MSLRGIIRRSDKSPLGSVEDVKRHLSGTFPGVRFILEKEEPPGLAKARVHMSLFLRLWIAVLGVRVRYPHWNGLYEARGAAVEFYFEADEPVRWIRGNFVRDDGGLGRLL
jgi:hypothetical protein